jgi:hypothetical protein
MDGQQPTDGLAELADRMAAIERRLAGIETLLAEAQSIWQRFAHLPGKPTGVLGMFAKR